MAIVVDAREAQAEQAASRIEARAEQRASNVEQLARPGGFAAVNSKELVARRLDRLTRYLTSQRLPGEAHEAPDAPPEEIAAAALRRAVDAGLPGAADAAAATTAVSAVDAAGLVLEAIIGSADFLDVRYLDAGVVAARAVARVHVHDATGGGGFGTGSLVTPRLLLTNNHVLPDARTAKASQVEFNFQLGLDGQPLASRIFGLDPDAFFLTDAGLDFALVAIAASAQELAQFGLNRFVEADGKVGIGEFVTIVQHPAARRKEISLRENRVVDELEQVLHYAADTEPGSSGSPVFNDQWEIVALHHASTPAPSHAELGGIVNEGIRISRVAAFVRAQAFAPAQQALVDQLGRFERIVLTTQACGPAGAAAQGADGAAANGGAPVPSTTTTAAVEAMTRALGGRGELSIPLELTVGVRSALQAPPPAAPAPGAEAIAIDPDYATRRGYDPAFLGADTPVALPELSEAQRASAAVNASAPAGADPHVLPYHHFSVVLDGERRLARFTAVNIDGARGLRLKREKDRWSLDPRVPVEQQTGEPVYADNALDRGHLVRRLDPAWGGSTTEAKLANDDTFHFTNCTPQHEDFNQNKTTWAGLEDYVLENADNRDLRVNVFSGPVLAADDDEYRGVKLPRQFWKVVTIVKASGQLSATAYLLSQQQLLHDGGFEALAAPAEFSYGAYRTFQVPIAGLSFGPLGAADPLAGLETTAAAAARAVERPEDLVL
jgi:endonuclease G